MLIMCFEMEIQICNNTILSSSDWREELEGSMASQTNFHPHIQ